MNNPDVMSLSIEQLMEQARKIRRDVLVMVTHAASGHPGGPLSMTDYLTALWFRYMRFDPGNPSLPERDRFVLSNGHASALNYALLARTDCFNPSYLLTFRSTESRLLGHPSSSKLPGIEISTGSLGQGLSAAHGMALGLRMNGLVNSNVFCNCGDGELQEGNIWEAVMAAGHYHTDNLVLSVDANNAQIDGYVHEVMAIEPLADKFNAFGWRVLDCDGHDMESICQAWETALRRQGKPTVILFRTIMMKGCPSYENIPGWHGRPPKPDECTQMLAELGFSETYEEAVRSYGEVKYL